MGGGGGGGGEGMGGREKMTMLATDAWSVDQHFNHIAMAS